MNKQDKKVLSEMINELNNSPAIYQPSKFWQDLNKAHLESLSTRGLKNFKRTLTNKYFSWGILGIIFHQLSPIFAQLIKGNFDSIINSRFEDYNLNLGKGVKRFNFLGAQLYRLYLVSLYKYVSKKDNLKILNNLNEPLVGNPFLVKYKGKLISQDLCNSINEFYTIAQPTKLPNKINIAELGAGYGRLGYVLLNTFPNSKYCVIDIPPALYVSQNYLSKVFNKEKIFRFRNFKSFKEVKKDFEQSRIQFIMPNQIELLPNKYFDLFINISSLHEMTREQIVNYFKQIDRLCKGYFYTKQWLRSRTKDNMFIKENEYPIPKKWKAIARRSPHPIQKKFFDTLYKIK